MTPLITVPELARRMNALEAKGHPGRDPVEWRHRNVVALLNTGNVPIYGRPNCTKFVLLADLKDSFPAFWESLLDAESIAGVDEHEDRALAGAA